MGVEPISFLSPHNAYAGRRGGGTVLSETTRDLGACAVISSEFWLSYSSETPSHHIDIKINTIEAHSLTTSGHKVPQDLG